jgi:hypothetical protein
MLTKVEARNPAGTLVSLELSDFTDGFAIKDIGGLGPVKATLTSSKFAGAPGAQFLSAHREERNITFQIGLEPDYVETSVKDLRAILYDVFMPENQVDLRLFDDDGTTVDISGWVETCEPTLFTDEPSVDISVMCFDPDFVEIDSITVEGETVEDSTTFTITYEGSVPAGFEFVLSVDRVLSDFSIYHTPPDGVTRTMDFAIDLVADDILTFNTGTGEKTVTLLRSSTLSSVLYALTPQSPWSQLAKGDNVFRVSAEGDPIPFTIEYTPRHGGL